MAMLSLILLSPVFGKFRFPIWNSISRTNSGRAQCDIENACFFSNLTYSQAVFCVSFTESTSSYRYFKNLSYHYNLTFDAFDSCRRQDPPQYTACANDALRMLPTSIHKLRHWRRDLRTSKHLHRPDRALCIIRWSVITNRTLVLWRRKYLTWYGKCRPIVDSCISLPPSCFDVSCGNSTRLRTRLAISAYFLASSLK